MSLIVVLIESQGHKLSALELEKLLNLTWFTILYLQILTN